jgi:hypothetical protein
MRVARLRFLTRLQCHPVGITLFMGDHALGVREPEVDYNATGSSCGGRLFERSVAPIGVNETIIAREA